MRETGRETMSNKEQDKESERGNATEKARKNKKQERERGGE